MHFHNEEVYEMGESNNESLTIKDYRDLVIESGMQAIPMVGGSLATLYFGYKQEKRFKRLESFYRELGEQIENMKDPIPHISKHNEDELNAIIEELHEKIESEHLQMKKDYYKQYYKNTLLYPVNGNFDERKLYLDILSLVTPLQIELIIFLANQSHPITGATIQKTGVEGAIIQGSISQLKNYGIIEGSLDSIVFGGTGNAINENISLTAFGRKFHEFCLR